MRRDHLVHGLGAQRGVRRLERRRPEVSRNRQSPGVDILRRVRVCPIRRCNPSGQLRLARGPSSRPFRERLLALVLPHLRARSPPRHRRIPTPGVRSRFLRRLQNPALDQPAPPRGHPVSDPPRRVLGPRRLEDVERRLRGDAHGDGGRVRVRRFRERVVHAPGVHDAGIRQLRPSPGGVPAGVFFDAGGV